MDETGTTIKRWLGVASRYRPVCANVSCPNVFELSDGDYLVVGTDVSEEFDPLLPAGGGRAPYERAVRVPRSVIHAAWADLRAA